MPRRQFVADLNSLRASPLPNGIASLTAGDDDGHVLIHYSCATASASITACIPELADYPTSHHYLFYGDDDTPLEIVDAFSRLEFKCRKQPLNAMLQTFSLHVFACVNGDLIEEGPDQDEEDDDYLGEEEITADIPLHSPHASMQNRHCEPRSRTSSFTARFQHDLEAASCQGIRINEFGMVSHGLSGHISLAIRMSRLKISREAMRAWDTQPDHYLVLLIFYKDHYRTSEELQALHDRDLSAAISLRVCMSSGPDPAQDQAVAAFQSRRAYETEWNIAEAAHQKVTSAGQQVKSLFVDSGGQDEEPTGDFEATKLKPTFISEPLRDLLESRLIPLLRLCSQNRDMTWSVAEDMLTNQIVGSHIADPTHKRQYDNQEEYQSFPLLAMQYAVRHFTHCTSFCLVCHRRLETDVEALKPYVCDNPLCLYQYMSLGLGPSLEHEIVSQPKVVDLLVSLCYVAAASCRVTNFPDGLNIMVPFEVPLTTDLRLTNPDYARSILNPTNNISKSRCTGQHGPVRYDRCLNRVTFGTAAGPSPVSPGQWIQLTHQAPDTQHHVHCVVINTSYFPIVDLSPPITTRLEDSNAQLPEEVAMYELVAYAIEFDVLSETAKRRSICTLLDTLPPVAEMVAYLKTGASSLSAWSHRISKHALQVLRWIIASNRACILEIVDPDELIHIGSSVYQPRGTFEKYSQFRFVMGAPDKEQRFITAVNQINSPQQTRYPTMFAWHGSPTSNWHSIIREGLHFRDTLHGRAYGHGVYHSLEASTSLNYSGRDGYISSSELTRRGRYWPSSALKIASVFALNELVHAKDQFVSQNPHLVVAQLDWIQTRFLFVSSRLEPNETVDPVVRQEGRPVYEQHQASTPVGLNGQKIVIPAAVLKTNSPWQRFKPLTALQTSEPSPPASVDASSPAHINNDGSLDDYDSPFFAPLSPKLNIKRVRHNGFSFADSNLCGIARLPVPRYARPQTTRHLMKELQSLKQIQEISLLSDLGWYVDFTKTDNVYQWIVELHSFDCIDNTLPLVRDLEARGLKSIVMEVQFNQDFPYSPPYARVIRPRFLTFMQGGGGHIVMGGAMCMELLTNTGWSSVLTMESVLLQIRLAIASTPPARLDNSNKQDYGTAEAADGYIRACRTHGWAIPPSFERMARGQ